MSKNNNNRKKPTEHERISREARIDRTIREYLTALRNFVDHKNKLAADCEFYDMTKKLRQYCRKHWDAIDAQTKSFFEEETPLIIDSEQKLGVFFVQHTLNPREEWYQPRLRNVVYSCID